MKTRADLGTYIKNELQYSYRLIQEDIGSDAHLSAKGMVFDTESYEIEGLGHLCVMKMNAFFGLMRMETVILSGFTKDVPLLNADWIRAFGKETQLVELYDTQLNPWSEEAQKAYAEILNKDSDLEDYSAGERWYDGIRYECSYPKKGKGVSERLSFAAQNYLSTFIRQLKDAPDCSETEKIKKNAEFADQLIREGGPAVDQMTKLFGKETAARMIRKHMYGIR